MLPTERERCPRCGCPEGAPHLNGPHSRGAECFDPEVDADKPPPFGNMPQGPDWRSMFNRYSGLVGESEGVDFLYPDNWTPEEWAAILALATEYGWDKSLRAKM